MIKKTRLGFLVAAFFALTVSACGGVKQNPTSSSNFEEQTKEIYSLAQKAGYDGTYEEWLASITGMDGATILTGTGEPADTQGKDGDIFINLDAWDIYRKTNGVWLKVGNIMGQQGPKGDQGPTGPAGQDGKDGTDGKDGVDGQDGKDGYTPYIGDNGNWWINGQDTGYKVVGNDGKDGQDGKDGADGKDGVDGQDGKDGYTPYIGDNGNWWINGQDTGYKVVGNDGKDGQDGKDGVDGKDGQDGKDGADGKDGYTPYIGDNGNWWINGQDTGYKAVGNDGKDGQDGQNGQNGKDGQDGQDGQNGADGLTPFIGENGNWWIGETDTGIKAAGTDGKDGQNGADGKDGVDGKDGQDGQDGQDGVSIIKTEINSDGDLIIYYSDGRTENAGHVQGESGSGSQPLYEGSEGLDFYPLDDGTYGVSLGNASKLSKVVIPETYNNKEVTKVFFDYSCINFWGENTFVKEVVLPETIDVIDEEAFYGFIRLNRINIPRNLSYVGKKAFANCSYLTDIYYNGRTDEFDELYNTIQFDESMLGLVSYVSCTDGNYYINLPESISVPNQYVGLNSGGKQLEYHIYPERDYNFKVTFASSDTSVVEITENGYLIPNSVGEATITVSLPEIGMSSEGTVAVVENATTEVKLDLWMPDGQADLTYRQIEEYNATIGLKEGYSVVANISEVSEGVAASRMINDPDYGADLYCIYQDQLSKLVNYKLLSPVSDLYVTDVQNRNDNMSVNASSLYGQSYAYPMTNDNGYFMYYDKSVISENDIYNLESIIEVCEDAGCGFAFNLSNAWYNVSFFFATGCYSEWNFDSNGNVIGFKDTYNSYEGLLALRGMEKLTKSSVWRDDSSCTNAFTSGSAVCISGTWDYTNALNVLGDNLGIAELPCFTVDGNTYHLSSFAGSKLMGVKPQSDEIRYYAAQSLANFLTNETCQLERFVERNYGPSNRSAQKSEEVISNPALCALYAQNEYAHPQGEYPGNWWDVAGYLGNASRDYDESSFANVLADYQNTIEKYYGSGCQHSNTYTDEVQEDSSNPCYYHAYEYCNDCGKLLNDYYHEWHKSVTNHDEQVDPEKDPCYYHVYGVCNDCGSIAYEYYEYRHNLITDLEYDSELNAYHVHTHCEVCEQTLNDTTADNLPVVEGETSVDFLITGQMTYFAFVPETSGYYYFGSSNKNGLDPWGELYDSSLNLLVSNDDYNNLDFRFEHYLEAGQLYFIGVRLNNSYEQGKYDCSLYYGFNAGHEAQLQYIEIAAPFISDGSSYMVLGHYDNGKVIDITNLAKIGIFSDENGRVTIEAKYQDYGTSYTTYNNYEFSETFDIEAAAAFFDIELDYDLSFVTNEKGLLILNDVEEYKGENYTTRVEAYCAVIKDADYNLFKDYMQLFEKNNSYENTSGLQGNDFIESVQYSLGNDMHLIIEYNHFSNELLIGFTRIQSYENEPQVNIQQLILNCPLMYNPETFEYQVIAVYSDGTQKDVTDEAKMSLEQHDEDSMNISVSYGNYSYGTQLFITDEHVDVLDNESIIEFIGQEIDIPGFESENGFDVGTHVEYWQSGENSYEGKYYYAITQGNDELFEEYYSLLKNYTEQNELKLYDETNGNLRMVGYQIGDIVVVVEYNMYTNEILFAIQTSQVLEAVAESIPE